MIPASDGAEPDKNRRKRPKHDHDGDNANRHQGGREKPGIPDAEDCLRAMAQLAGLVAMGLMKPAQANAIRAAFEVVLRHHKDKAKEAEKGLSNADVMELLRKDPQLLSLLEPLLTSDQVAMVMKAAGGSTDG